MRHQVLQQFGNNVRRLRKQKGLSQEELAAESKSHRNYIGAVERGERNITLAKMVDVATALNCPLSLLLCGIEKRLPPKV